MRRYSLQGQPCSNTFGGRANALLGGGGKRSALLVALLASLLAAIAGSVSVATAATTSAYVTPALRASAEQTPDATFDVIVTGTRGVSSSTVETAVDDTRTSTPGNGVGVKRRFASISGTSAQLTGKQILKLAGKSGVEAIVPDAKVTLTAYSNNQIWPQSAGTTTYGWATPPSGTSFPTIAIVDSGVSSRAAFGSRLVGSVDLSTSSGSGAFGHGTFVASIAAGGDTAYGGAEPHANVFSIKVLDGAGVGYKSDAIAAADWILQNKGTYNIRVANFSINTVGDSILYDPLDQAVENLWLNGVVVVVAAGNYAVNGQRSDVGFAPANDPYVITVGASDTNGTSSRSDDFAAPWSAWGYTQDGFFKPELAAPGRHLNGAVPNPSALLTLFPTRLVLSGTYPYMWMSGTSFATPVVSGIAATLLSRHPSWTPDQVKGALMASVSVPSGYGSNGALGVGVVNGAGANGQSGSANPNAGLNQFVYWDSGQSRYEFDAKSWKTAASSNASWNSASWSSASWSSASWSSASWSSASWSSASWSSASWSSASWANASWASNTGVE